jgi:anti-anti-sigma factor
LAPTHDNPVPDFVIDVADALTPYALVQRAADAARRGANVAVDLSGAAHLDSRFLRALVAADKQTRAMGRYLVLRGVRGEVQRMLVATGMDGRFEVDGPAEHPAAA